MINRFGFTQPRLGPRRGASGRRLGRVVRPGREENSGGDRSQGKGRAKASLVPVRRAETWRASHVSALVGFRHGSYLPLTGLFAPVGRFDPRLPPTTCSGSVTEVDATREGSPSGRFNRRFPGGRLGAVRHPWTPLTEWLSLPFGSSSLDGEEDPEVEEAWTETAARLGLVRLGWRPVGREGDFDLAYPCERALVKASERRGILDGGGPGEDPGGAGSQETTLAVQGGELVVAAPPGDMPPRKALLEVGTLAAAMGARRAARERLRRAERAATQGRNAAAAAHDLRNELTRAVLYATRGDEEDGPRVLEALSSARELAQAALGSEATQRGPRPTLIRIKDLLLEEAKAATAAARGGADGPPALRVKCKGSLFVLAPRNAMARAVRNLLTNALEAAARGANGPGTVTVQVDQRPSRDLGLDLDVVVADDGDGMAPAALKVFLDGGLGAGGASRPGGRSLQVEGQASLPEAPSSTGLGTASLRLALSEVGAGLRVESGAGRGTRACISVRSADADGDPVILIDGDQRRARSRVERLARESSARTWLFHSAVGALGTIRAGRAAAVHCALDTVRPDLRAEVAQACAAGGVRLQWVHPSALTPAPERESVQGQAPSPVGAA